MNSKNRCPECGAKCVVKQDRIGTFYSCTSCKCMFADIIFPVPEYDINLSLRDKVIEALQQYIQEQKESSNEE